jgi:hypothetical protein
MKRAYRCSILILAWILVPGIITSQLADSPWPTYSNAAFPPVRLSNSLPVPVPAGAGYTGDYVFATAFLRHGTGKFIRTDGLPVENSNLVMNVP